MFVKVFIKHLQINKNIYNKQNVLNFMIIYLHHKKMKQVLQHIKKVLNKQQKLECKNKKYIKMLFLILTCNYTSIK